jgi:hypothetical protein
VKPVLRTLVNGSPGKPFSVVNGRFARRIAQLVSAS